jgi:hypothetical protein
MTTTEAAIAVLRSKTGRDPLSDITEATAHYLVGGLGKVPKSADPELVKMALNKLGLDKPLEFKASEALPSDIDAARQKLAARGIQNPDNWDLLTVIFAGDKSKPDMGLDLVTQKYQRNLAPQQPMISSIERYVDGLPAVSGLAGTLTKNWKQKGGAGVDTQPHLPRDLYETLGGAAGFEYLAQAVTEIYRNNNRASLPRWEKPGWFKQCQKKWLDEAADKIQAFQDAVADYYRTQPVTPRALKGLNALIYDVCSQKGVIDPSGRFMPRFDTQTFRNLQIHGAPEPELLPDE